MSNGLSFGQRVRLSIIDKIVLGLVILGAAGVWDGSRAVLERALVRREEVGAVLIDRPLAMLPDLSELLEEYIVFVEERKAAGFVTPDELDLLHDHRVKAAAKVSVIGAYCNGEAVSASGMKLNETIREFNAKAAEGKARRPDHIRLARELRAAFAEYSRAVVEACIGSIESTLEEDSPWTTRVYSWLLGYGGRGAGKDEPTE